MRILILSWLALTATGVAQTFEAASVRPSDPPPKIPVLVGGPGTRNPGRIAYTSVNLRALIEMAYGVQDDQVSGPSWLGAERYDVQATLPQGVTEDQFRLMLQHLLAERFRLSLHRMKKAFEVYELSQAKSGSKLKTNATLGEGKPATEGRGGLVNPDGFPVPPLHLTAQRAANGVAKLAGNQVTMAQFAGFLKSPLALLTGSGDPFTQRVIDKTGLDGEFTFALEYERPGQKPVGADPGDLAPDLFTALEQQLGLRLEKTKQELDVLVIDHAEKTPSEN